MEPTYFAQYRGFEFQCSPERLGVNAFAPRLVIHDVTDSLTLEIPVQAPSLPVSDPTTAAHLAFAQGRRWVDGGYTAAVDQAAGRGPRLLER
ncbi:MAG: hypothetical protein M3O01_03995 [Pseudomonadota bacterium]|nr:hypothetical protein [Pseudomonadota bacterium]